MADDDSGSPMLSNFEDPDFVANYAEVTSRFVPGRDALHRTTAILLAEHAPADAHVLVVGAGGGLELKALAEAQPGWTFVGIDPSPDMLQLAERTLGSLAPRVTLVEGYIDDAPAGPFDAATCLLTLHFLDRIERGRTVRAIHDRLKPGAPFVAAHGSFPQEPAARSRWLRRYADYALASGAHPEQVATAHAAVAASVTMFAPDEDEAMLREGGFADAELFFAAFTWRGWVGHA
ncbi:class I SAM-dependent methyltransferase [Sphingomonas sp.]|uniref:class I SAM-dependent methyltransferase n=1 Tax=Sphingomonas sp. TaxID=28214 RepID=UPI0035C7D6D4